MYMPVMMTRLLKLVSFALLVVGITGLAFAQRYLLPSDEEVLVRINQPGIEAIDPDAIRLLVWNLYKGSMQGWQRDYQDLSADKDLLMLQEILLGARMEHTFMADKGNAYVAAVSFYDSWNNNAATGVATASAVKPVDMVYMRSENREPFAGTPKMGLLVEYRMQGLSSTLLTANVHSLNFVGAEKHRKMLDSLETLLSTHDGPLIMAGDFNTWSEARTRVLRDTAKRLGLIEVTFSHDERTSVMGNVLDWIFIRGLKIHESRVHVDINSSDHRALEARFSVVDGE